MRSTFESRQSYSLGCTRPSRGGLVSNLGDVFATLVLIFVIVI
jgi:hypothetical protein